MQKHWGARNFSCAAAASLQLFGSAQTKFLNLSAHIMHWPRWRNNCVQPGLLQQFRACLPIGPVAVLRMHALNEAKLTLPPAGGYAMQFGFYSTRHSKRT